MRSAGEDSASAEHSRRFAWQGGGVGEAASAGAQKGLASFAAKLQRAKHSGEDLLNSFASLLPSAQSATPANAAGGVKTPEGGTAVFLGESPAEPDAFLTESESVSLEDVQGLDAETLLQRYRQRKAEVRTLHRRLREAQDAAAASAVREKKRLESQRRAVEELGRVLRRFGVVSSRRVESASPEEANLGETTPLPTSAFEGAQQREEKNFADIVDWSSRLCNHLSRIETDRFSLASFCQLLFPHCPSLEKTAEAAAAALSGGGDAAFRAAAVATPIDSEELRRLWLEMEEERLVGSAQLELQKELHKQRENLERLRQKTLELEAALAQETKEKAQLLLRLLSQRKSAAVSAAAHADSGLGSFHCLGCSCPDSSVAETSPAMQAAAAPDSAVSPSTAERLDRLEGNSAKNEASADTRSVLAEQGLRESESVNENIVKKEAPSTTPPPEKAEAAESESLQLLQTAKSESEEALLRQQVQRLEEELRRHRSQAEKLLAQKDAALLRLKQRLLNPQRQIPASSAEASPAFAAERSLSGGAESSGGAAVAVHANKLDETPPPPTPPSASSPAASGGEGAEREGAAAAHRVCGEGAGEAFNKTYFKHVFLKYVHLKEKADPAAQQLLSVLSVLLDISDAEREALFPQPSPGFWWS